ncbi:MAG: hypothetical protein ACTSWX_11600 [Promethearchaeota archaeon]
MAPFPLNCPKCNERIPGVKEPKKKSQRQLNREKKEPKVEKKIFSGEIIKEQIRKKNEEKKAIENVPIFKTIDTSSFGKPEIDLSDFSKNLKIKANPDIIVSDKIENVSEEQKIEEIKISKISASDSDTRVKVKVKKSPDIDLSNTKIDLGKNDEYLKFMGITTKDRKELYYSNEKFRYFLELGSNLDFIATSILSGELDRMELSPLDGGKEEICYFLSDKDFLYIIYGNIPDKKAAWLLNQMKIFISEILRKKDVNKLTKIDLYNVKQNFPSRVKFILNQYIKLQDVFTSRKLRSLDNFLRVDYFGLSYQSIGVISKIITNELEIEGLPPIDPDNESSSDFSQMEMAEALITAKVEAMAANTVANTQMMPNWISVKLGFQHYRFILFSKLGNYYISLLIEGNLDLKKRILEKLHQWLAEVTQKPFTGVLEEFKKVQDGIVEYLKEHHKNISLGTQEF